VPFTTKDNDNDQYRGKCAYNRDGARWFNACGYSSLNGKYLSKSPAASRSDGITWYSWAEHYISMKKTYMMIRRL